MGWGSNHRVTGSNCDTPIHHPSTEHRAAERATRDEAYNQGVVTGCVTSSQCILVTSCVQNFDGSMCSGLL